MFARKRPAILEVASRVFSETTSCWVVFENGTVVTFPETPEDPLSAAKQLMSEFGPVHAGCPAGDFNVVRLRGNDGWIVTSHHQQILTHVPIEEFEDQANELAIGLFGRANRDKDAREQKVTHVEIVRLRA